MSLTFKSAGEKDIPVIAALANRIWRKHYTPIIGHEQVEYMLKSMYDPESILQQMKKHQDYTIVYDQEIPIGYISISTKDQKNYFLHKFYVEVDKQRGGVGSELLDYILSTIKTAETIELTVNRQNYKAINFYFKKGFTIREVTDFDIGNGFVMNDFIMMLRLPAASASKV